MTESKSLTDTQRRVTGQLIRARFDGLWTLDGNQERTLRSLRRRGLAERRDGRWWPTAAALGYKPGSANLEKALEVRDGVVHG